MRKEFVIVGQGEPCFVEEDGGHSTNGILGGPIPVENAYLSAYAVYPGPHPETLEIGQRTKATFSLSGSKGTYDVVRVR